MSGAPETSAVPTAHVLGYLTSTGTPTRVRQVAAAGVAWMSWIFLLVFLGLAALCVPEFVRLCREYLFMVSIGVSWSSALGRVDDSIATDPRTFLLGASLFLFISTRIAARPIRRGRRWACFLASWVIAPAACATMAAAAWCFTLGIGEPLGLLLYSRHRAIFLLWLLPAPVLTLCTLILLDLLRFVNWIGRNPDAEKPETHFLPRGH